MHDKIADFQVAQIREKRLCQIPTLLLNPTLLFEDIGLCVNLESPLFERKSF